MTPQWQPIGSAPKDGTQFFAWMPTYYQGKGGFALCLWLEGEWYDNKAWVIKPTHWQPLPLPPGEEPDPQPDALVELERWLAAPGTIRRVEVIYYDNGTRGCALGDYKEGVWVWMPEYAAPLSAAIIAALGKAGAR